MKQLLLLLALLTSVVATWGQGTEIDKLKRELQSHLQKDTFRVNRLNGLVTTNGLSVAENEKLSQEALAISREINYAMGEGYALLNLFGLKYQSQRSEAMRLLKEADSIANAIDDQELQAYVYLSYMRFYQANDNQEALKYAVKAEQLAEKTSNSRLLYVAYIRMSSMYRNSLSNFPVAMEYNLRAISAAGQANCQQCLSDCYSNMGALYNLIGDDSASLVNYQKAAEANKRTGNKVQERRFHVNIGERHRLMGNYPEALREYYKSLDGETSKYSIELLESDIADVYVRMDSLPKALQYASRSLAGATSLNDVEGVAWINGIFARAYLKKHMPDSAIYHALRGLDAAIQTGTIEFMRDNTGALANAYAFKKNFDNAYKYHVQYVNYRDSMLNTEIKNKASMLQYSNDLAQKQGQIATLDKTRKAQRNFLISALVGLLLIIFTSILLLRSNQRQQRTNRLLKKQKQEIEAQRDKTDKTLSELQQTQRQLIQSEKMASLGELTAGIAHEIQNPLNFVNNFSEISVELISDLQQHLTDGNTSEAIAIAGDVKANQEKINYHGKRAESIVKGMLQHSRVSSGQKEPTDINALCDEYLRLAYHGLRAKDKSFNADYKTYFDERIGKVNIVPQDMGRVLINLFNNAFYAVNEKKRQLDGSFFPKVMVSTIKTDGSVMLTVNDNGNGMPQDIVDKIFQPFFTTKPAGQGTGLGLSLTYDIVKAHGGEISVKTKEGEGTEFVLRLPV